MKFTTILQKETRKLIRLFTHHTFLYLVFIGNALMITSIVVFYFFEKEVNPHIHSFFDSIWWGVTTITTVGYGDIVPLTFPGKLTGLFLMYTGTVLFIAFVGVLVAFLMDEKVEHEILPLETQIKKEEKDQESLKKMVKDLKKQIEHLEEKI